MNILSVHFHSQVHQQVEELLQTRGHTVNTAYHGKEALSLLRDRHVDGIMSDGYLPEMDGFQLCRAVKSHESFRRIPFVFLVTAYDEKDEAFAVNLGASGMFSPSDPQKVLPIIEKALQAPCEPEDILEEPAYLKEHDTRIKTLLDKTLLETEKIREELSQSEIKYQNLFEGAHDATFIMDARGGHIEANKKASELLGYTLDEFKKLSFREIVVPSDVPDSEQKLDMMLRGENIPIYEKNFRAKDGRIIPVEISVSGVRDSSGKIAHIQSIVRDITERKKGEKALRESEEKYRTLVEQANDGIATIQGGLLKYVNPRWVDMTGYSVKELLHTPATDYIQSEKICDLLNHDLISSDDAAPTPLREAVLRRKDGDTLNIEVNAGRTTCQGHPAVLMIMRDITEKKQAQKALAKSEQKYRDLFENAPLGIYRTTPEGSILMANPALVRMLGYDSFKELVKQNLEEDGFKAGYPRSAVKEKLEQEGQITGMESAWRRKDGTTLFFRENAKAVCDNGNILYYEGTMEDITEWKQAEIKLRESEERYRNIVELAPNGIATIDLKGVVTSCNTACLHMTGLSEEEIVGNHFTNLPFLNKKDIPQYIEIFSSFIRERPPTPFELSWVHKDGSTRWGEVYVAFMKKDGSTTGLQVMAQDITERKKAEIQLRESEEKYRNIVELAPDGIITANLKGFITSCNTAFLSISGYSRDEIVGKHISRLPTIRARDLPTYIGLFSSLVRGKPSAPFEFTWVHKNGSTRWGEIHTSIMKKDGKIVRVQAVVRDITERKQSEEQLRESEERYRNIVELAPDGIATLDLKGVITSCNTAFSTLTGFTTDEIVGKHISRLPTIRARDLPSYLKMFGSFIRGKLTLPVEFKWVHKNGDIRWGEVHATRIKKGRKTVGVQIITRDVTERKRAEEQLRESEEKYRNIVELAPSGIITMDVKGFITSCNTAFSNISGYSEEEIVGKHFTKAPTIHARDISHFVKIFGSLLRGKISVPLEFTWIHKDGSTRLGEVYVALMRKGRHLIGLQALLLDITERKRTEKMLQLSEKKYRSLVGNLNIGVYRSTPGRDGEFIDVNQAFADMLGYTRDELMNLKISSLYVDPKERMRFNEKMIAEGAIKNEELCLKKKDETPVIVSDTSTAVYDTDGTLLHFDGVTEDITRRKETEEELKKYRTHLEELVEHRTTNLKEANQQLQREIAERFQVEESLAAEKERLAVTLRSIGEGVITTDTAGKVVLINKVAEQLTGYTQEEAAGRPLNEIFNTVNEETRIPCTSPVAEVMDRGFLVDPDRDVLLIAKDRTERVVSESGAPIRDRNSRIIGVVLVFRDVTERQKMEQDLLRAQKLESLGILAGGIAHDFNNILTAIVDNVALARLYTQENRVVEKLTKVEKASLQAKNLTQQLLTFSKGGAPIKKVTVITELIKDSASFALRGSKVRCHFEIPGDLWPSNIDEGQISQVINNLIINADQAMPEGGTIQVHAKNTTVTHQDQLPVRPGKYIKISITDEGVGIPERYLSKIFDPYFTTKQKGSGLGLATSYSIVNRHNGHIDAASQVGKGTTVYVWLPASFEKTEYQVVEPSGYVKGKGKILLMDDEDIILEAAGDVLQHLGYHVECARDGAEAIVLYKKAQTEGIPFDVVIMDLTIPGGMGGEEAIKELKKVDPHVQAIVSSGYSNDPVMADYREYGFCDVVTKPYTLEELSETVRRALNGENP